MASAEWDRSDVEMSSLQRWEGGTLPTPRPDAREASEAIGLFPKAREKYGVKL